MKHSLSKNSAIFLAIVLVVGTISTIIPTTTFAQSEYKGYEDSYGKDYDKKKSKDVNLQKVKCNNIILNGVDAAADQGTIEGNDMVGAMTNAEDNDMAGQQDSQWFGNGEKKPNDIDQNIVNFCINKNQNEQANLPDGMESTLIVNKVVTCESIPPNGGNAILACNSVLSQISPNDFTIMINGNNPNPSQFEGSSIPVEVTLDPGNYQVSETEDPSVAEDIDIIEGTRSVDITQEVIFIGDCDAVTGEGTIAAGDFDLCTVQNAFTSTSQSG